MIANYGYEDGSGSYYITIDTNKCGSCQHKDCLAACPAELFLLELDDWDNEVVVIRNNVCNLLRDQCAECKTTIEKSEQLPCQKACDAQAIIHSW